MGENLRGTRIAILVMDGVERVELVEPCLALRKADAEVHVVSPEGDWVRAWEGTEWWASGVDVDVELIDADPEQYQALVLPGGIHNAERMRTNPAVVDFTRHFARRRKPIAAICRGAWTLIEADAVDGRKVTSHPALRTDLLNAGAEWIDDKAVVDGELVTGRMPGDLPAFITSMKACFAANHSSGAR